MTAPPATTPSTSVVIVTHQSADDIERCLESVVAHTHRLDLSLVVVDNASTDETADLVSRWATTSRVPVHLDHSALNLGFGAAVNRGVAASTGDWIVLLNPDTECTDGALDALVEFAMTNPRAGLVGGRTLAPDGSLEPSSCWGAPTVWSTICFGLGLGRVTPLRRWLDPETIPGWDRDSVREVGVVTGCLLAVERDTWNELGGFDERFFMYSEDTDLSMRARRAGYTPLMTPRATVIHSVGGSSDMTERRIMILRGRVELIRRHFSPLGARVSLAALRLGALLRATAERLGSTDSRGQRPWRAAWRRRDEWMAGWSDRVG